MLTNFDDVFHPEKNRNGYIRNNMKDHLMRNILWKIVHIVNGTRCSD